MSENTSTPVPSGPGSTAPTVETVELNNSNTNQEKIEAKKEADEVDAPKIAAPEVEKDDKFAKKFAALGRREKATKQRENELKIREQSILAKQQELDNASKPKEEHKEKEIPLDVLGKRDPLAALEKMGWSYEKLTQYILNDKKLDPDSHIAVVRDEVRSELEEKFSAEISAIKKQLEDRDTETNDKAKKQEEEYLASVIENFKGEINDFVEKNKEAYELTYINEGQELVFETVDAYFNKYGKVLTVEEATKTVEQYLEEEANSLYSRSNKLKAKLGASNPEKKTEPVTKNSSSFTLTNEAANKSPSDKKPYLSDEESKKMAAKMIRYIK